LVGWVRWIEVINKPPFASRAIDLRHMLARV